MPRQSDGTSPREYTYNHLGQLTQVTDDAGVRTISYNAYGERAVDSLLAEGVSHVISEQWDEFGRSVGYTYAKDGVTQQVATQAYGREGRIATAGFLHGGTLKNFEYSYLPGSNLLGKLTMPNNMTLTQSYEPQRDLLTGMEYKRGVDLVTQRSYTYDALGRPTKRDTQYPGKGITHNDSFAHNSRSELVHAQLDDAIYGYDYDNIGNRRIAIEDSESSIYEANELNQYTSIADGADTFEPQFDLAGNQTLVKTNTGIWRVTYNAENRPIRFESEDGNIVVECAYDSMGRRATKKVTTNGEVTLHHRYIYRGYLQIAACDLTRSTSPNMWHILWDPTQPTATRPLAIRKDGVWYAYGWDLTKNICEIYGQTGYIRTLYTYTPYGAVTAEGDVTQPIQWSSEFYDEELGLVYYNYRYYNTLDGKWLSMDRILDDYNIYRALRNSPINGIDVKGEWFWVAYFIIVYGVAFVNAPSPDDDPNPKPDPYTAGMMLAIDLLEGLAVTFILKVAGCAIGSIKFNIFRVRAKKLKIDDIIPKNKHIRATSVAFDARKGTIEIGSSGRAKTEIVQDAEKVVQNLINEAQNKFGNTLKKNYPIGNCAEVDAINKLIKKGSAIQDVRIFATYKNRETLRTFKENKKPVIMEACEYCKYMFKSNLINGPVKIETPTIYILPGGGAIIEQIIESTK